MKPFTPQQCAEANKLAERAKAGDARAQEKLILTLRPNIKAMANAFLRNNVGIVDKDDLEQSALEAMYKIVHNWNSSASDSSFLLYAVRSIHYLMIKTHGNSRYPTAKKSTVQQVSAVAKQLDDQLGRHPTIDEIKANLEARSANGISKRDTIVAALEASADPLHLSYEIPGSDEPVSARADDPALVTEDVYFADEEEEVTKAGFCDSPDLERKIVSLPAKARFVLQRYLELDGDLLSLAQEAGFTTPIQAKNAVDRAVAKLDTLDHESLAVKERMFQDSVHKQVEADMRLLDLLPSRAREYFQSALSGRTAQQIAAQFDVAQATVEKSLERSSRNIDQSQICALCSKRQIPDHFKDGTVCTSCEQDQLVMGVFDTFEFDPSVAEIIRFRGSQENPNTRTRFDNTILRLVEEGRLKKIESPGHHAVYRKVTPTKVCPGCTRDLPHAYFGTRTKEGKVGLQSRCKSCRALIDAENWRYEGTKVKKQRAKWERKQRVRKGEA